MMTWIDVWNAPSGISPVDKAGKSHYRESGSTTLWQTMKLHARLNWKEMNISMITYFEIPPDAKPGAAVAMDGHTGNTLSTPHRPPPPQTPRPRPSRRPSPSPPSSSSRPLFCSPLASSPSLPAASVVQRHRPQVASSPTRSP